MTARILRAVGDKSSDKARVVVEKMYRRDVQKLINNQPPPDLKSLPPNGWQAFFVIVKIFGHA